jgi:hypothetical protein
VGKQSSSPRMAPIRVEYRCLDCGHVGWSAHKDIVRRFEREQAATP